VKSKTSQRKKCDPAAYQDATAFEALVGYLYLTDADRCDQLLRWVYDEVIAKDDAIDND